MQLANACLLVLPALFLPCIALSQQSAAHREIVSLVEQHSGRFVATSKSIWELAETGYQEEKSSALLQAELKQAGFRVERPLSDMPTAFVATSGQGKPVIGILGEFDALPGLSQAAQPDRRPAVADAPGHGCGHNLLGSGAALAVVALKEYMEKTHASGTLRYYGSPAEEGGAGKVYMIRAGLFRDVDVVLHWHPDNHNGVWNGGWLANNTGKFTFHGLAAHAALAPDRGRSALDAVMLMGNGIEFLREHVPSNSRIHYSITNGGAAPNVVPDTAELYIVARSPSLGTLQGIWERLINIAKGAALMTETTYELRQPSGTANILPNDALARIAQRNLEEVGGFRYSPDEVQFAERLRKSMPAGEISRMESTAAIEPLRPADPNAPAASTDVGDVSWNVPTMGFLTATFVPGVVHHTWQATACSGVSIGQKGMIVAAKALAITAADLFASPQSVADAKADFHRQLEGKIYRSVIPEGQKPPLDYRKK